MLSSVEIKNFRGISEFQLDFPPDAPAVIIGANNAGKSTILNAIALALHGGGSHQWQFSETDFYLSPDGVRSKSFSVKIRFSADEPYNLPAVKGVGKPCPVYGTLVEGRIQKNGQPRISRKLLGADDKAVSYSPRTSLSKQDKELWVEQDINFCPINARPDEIREHLPDIWLLTPNNVEQSLYIWKTGPLARLSKHLADKFLEDEWELVIGDNKPRTMPEALVRAHQFLKVAVEEFPFWRDNMKPALEQNLSKYVGSHTKIAVRPDTLSFRDWLAQQLSIEIAAEKDNPPTPLKNLGLGWQSLVRIAALETLNDYPELVREKTVLLIEEPETFLHPHLRRKTRKVLKGLAEKGWTIIITTHSAELVSFNESQQITRIGREAGEIRSRTLRTSEVGDDAKFQSRLDEKGVHEFLFSSGVIFCEGRDDHFAVTLAFDKVGFDHDSKSISVAQCGSVTAIPAFTEIANKLGIRWCALTDEDKQADGSIKEKTVQSREKIERLRGQEDAQILWKNNLEFCLGVDTGKAKPEVTYGKLSRPNWQQDCPEFYESIERLRNWAG